MKGSGQLRRDLRDLSREDLEQLVEWGESTSFKAVQAALQTLDYYDFQKNQSVVSTLPSEQIVRLAIESSAANARTKLILKLPELALAELKNRKGVPISEIKGE